MRGPIFRDLESYHWVQKDHLAEVNLFAQQRDNFQTNLEMLHLHERGRGVRLVSTQCYSVGVNGKLTELERKILNPDFCSHGRTCLLLNLGEQVSVKSRAAEDQVSGHAEGRDTRRENRC